MKKTGLSIVLATYNEENNLGDCLESVKDIADEIIVVDGSSTDATVEIAKKYNAKVTIVENQQNFHINKQKALELARFEWILQLDADERVSKKLAKEIEQVIISSEEELKIYQKQLPSRKLFLRHQKLLETREGAIGSKEGKYAAFFIPRLNYFLGKYLRFGGVYPDGVIRLVRKGYAHFPAKDVHEQISINGKVGWLQNPLLHEDSPTFKRYLEKNNRYVVFLAQQLKDDKIKKDFITQLDYLVIKPISWFFATQIRHKGILDGYQGLLFSLFSALRFPRAYLKYLTEKK